jgi:hypothetical protein
MKHRMTEEGPMNATILNYPGFQTLPKGIKQMLLVSESHFFDPPVPHYTEQENAAQAARSNRAFSLSFQASAERRPELTQAGIAFGAFPASMMPPTATVSIRALG